VENFSIRRAASKEDWACAETLVDAYADEIQVDLSFQGFSNERVNLAEAYSAPGGLWLAMRARQAAGCVALRRHTQGYAELKRLFVLPVARGQGIGQALVQRAVAEARTAGMAGVRLDTLLDMKGAQAVYRRLGFRQVPAFGGEALPGTQFYGLTF
jgi:GNAT superfamily N-acetyltransferase